MKRVLSLVVAAVLVTAATLTLTIGPAVAEITVNETADELNADGDCSLREAVETLNTGAPVDACAMPVDHVINLPAGTLSVDDNLDIPFTTHLEALLTERSGARVRRLVKPSGTAPSPSSLIDDATGSDVAVVGIGL